MERNSVEMADNVAASLVSREDQSHARKTSGCNPEKLQIRTQISV